MGYAYQKWLKKQADEVGDGHNLIREALGLSKEAPRSFAFYAEQIKNLREEKEIAEGQGEMDYNALGQLIEKITEMRAQIKEIKNALESI